MIFLYHIWSKLTYIGDEQMAILLLMLFWKCGFRLWPNGHAHTWCLNKIDFLSYSLVELGQLGFLMVGQRFYHEDHSREYAVYRKDNNYYIIIIMIIITIIILKL